MDPTLFLVIQSSMHNFTFIPILLLEIDISKILNYRVLNFNFRLLFRYLETNNY